MIHRIDNGLPNQYQNDIENLVTTLPYYYHLNTSYLPEDQTYIEWVRRLNDNHIKDNGQLSHGVYKDGKVLSDVYGLVYPILYIFADKINITVKEITRIKINLLLKDETFTYKNYNCPHSDYGADTTFVYYVNTSDGDTVLFDKFDNETVKPSSLNVVERINPIKGSGVFFNAMRFHASSNPRISQTRYVINYNFK